MNKRLLAAVLSIITVFSVIFASVPFFALAEDEAAEEASAYKGNIIGGGFETQEDLDAWELANTEATIKGTDTAYTLAVETEDTYSGEGALHITGDMFRGSKRFEMGSVLKEGAAAELNPSREYFLSFYIKTSEDFSGSVYAKVKQDGQFKKYNSSTELNVLGDKKTATSGYTVWANLKTPSFAVTNTDDVEITVYVNGTGDIWIDDITLTLDRNILSNGDMEGNLWDHWGSQDEAGEGREKVTDVTYASPTALKMWRDETTDESGELYLVTGHKSTFDKDETYRLSFDIKMEDVPVGGFSVRILQWYTDPTTGKDGTAWLRVYGEELFLKNGGTADWQNIGINVSGFHTGIRNFTFFVSLKGHGTVWLDNIKMEPKEKSAVAAGTVGVDTDEGAVEPGTVIKLYTSDDTSDIYYTVDGSDPKTSQTALLHSDRSGVQITEDTLIRAYTVGEEDTMGEIYEFRYTVTQPLIPDDKLWNNLASNTQITLDSTTAKTGSNSMKLVGNGSKLYAQTGEIGIDSNFDYKIGFWVKTEGLQQEKSAYVNIFIHGLASLTQNELGIGGQYYESQYELVEIAPTQDWTYYEFDIDDLGGAYTGLSLGAGINYDFGTMWIDGVTLNVKQKQNYALTVSGDGVTWGNNYYQSIFSSYEINQGFHIKSTAKIMETGTMHYTVYNDLYPEDILAEGDIALTVMPGATTASSVNLSMVAQYGTYTVDFTMKNSRGLSYDAGSIKVARARDNSDLEDTMFGFNVNLDAMNHENIDNIGATTVRIDLDWENVEGTEDAYKIADNVKNNVISMNEIGVDTIVIFNSHTWPSWYKERYAADFVGSSGFPRSEGQKKDFCEFVAHVVTELKDYTKYYELFNETNYMGYTKCTGEEYVALMKEVYKTIKAIDPDAKLIVGGMASIGIGKGCDQSYCNAIFKAGGADYMDIFSFHPYINPCSPESVDWASQIQGMYDTMRQYTDKDIPFWLTEMGYTATLTDRGNTEVEKRDYFVRVFSWAEKLGFVDRIVIYREGSNNNYYNFESRWGMFESTSATAGTANPVAVALGNKIYMQTQYDFSEQVQLANGLYSFKYSGNADNAKKDMYMLWTDDVEYLATITASDDSARLYDIYGNAVSIDVTDNAFTTDVSGRAIYVVLDKGETITSVELLNPDGSTIDTPTDDNSGSNDNGTSDNSGNSGNSYYSDNTSADAGEDTSATVQQVKRVKKVTKKVVSKGNPGTTVNWLPVIIGAVAAVLAAAIAIFLIIFLKKKKKKEQQTA